VQSGRGNTEQNISFDDVTRENQFPLDDTNSKTREIIVA